MNAHTAIRPATGHTEQLNAWYRKSGVGHCSTCNDLGVVASQRRATINDPYPETTCDDCGGDTDHACKVCGNTVHVKGFDCLACDMVLELGSDQLDDDTAAELAKAVVQAVKVAREHRARLSKLFAPVLAGGV